MDLGKVKEALQRAGMLLAGQMYHTDYIEEALAELERPAECDANYVAERILNDCDGTRDTLSLCANYLQQYAESYHAKKCAEQWIDIAERLPEKFDEYVCISMKDACPVHRPYVAVYRTMDNSWTKLNGATCFPSHWQPLPEAPRA